MREGSIILTPMPQADGTAKNRPALVLREMPPYRDLLVCGISTQLHQCVEGFDEVMSSADSDFAPSGLQCDSLIRLGFLALVPRRRVLGAIGAVDDTRHGRLLQRLAASLVEPLAGRERRGGP
ncbi:MAG: type II toxin-antitoxin system PemK/MazF family toxin [Armatimonadetes bacterium]|nr:type II toxin-antitoxin system PemK/MazF family toxin [Armatimonadota bacterium]